MRGMRLSGVAGRARHWAISVLMLSTVACGGDAGESDSVVTAAVSEAVVEEAVEEAVEDAKQVDEKLEALADDPLLAAAVAPWTGDLDGMLKRGFIRIAVPFGPTTYYIHNNAPAGITPMRVAEFEKALKKKFGKQAAKLTMVYIPASRANILKIVADGRADIAAADITVTEAREDLLDFAIPFRSNVKEVLVSGPSASDVNSVDDLAKYAVYVREKSSFNTHLKSFNAAREAAGKPALTVEYIDPALNSTDVVELVNAGALPATVADELVAELYQRSMPDLKIFKDEPVADSTEIAWAMRKNSPQLKQELDAFAKKAKKGTMLGNMMLNRYTKSDENLDNAMAADNKENFNRYVKVLQKYSDKFEFDWLMITAQAYQESKIDNSKRSRAGAVGIMQIKPSTARDPNVGINDISSAEDNVHAGVKYLRFIRDRYYSDEAIDELNQTLLSFAAYNAGPAAINRARREAERLGLDPNVWMDNVEVAVQRKIGMEPVRYVRNIYKYYVTYKLSLHQIEQRRS